MGRSRRGLWYRRVYGVGGVGGDCGIGGRGLWYRREGIVV